LAIEERIVGIFIHPHPIPDFFLYLSSLETYLQYRPPVAEQFPSAVPLRERQLFRYEQLWHTANPFQFQEQRETLMEFDLQHLVEKYVNASASGTHRHILYSPKRHMEPIFIIKTSLSVLENSIWTS